MSTRVCKLSSSAADVFNFSPIMDSSYVGYYGSIYVPASLITAYKTSTYWSTISNRLVGV
jgi:hypothetical protein